MADHRALRVISGGTGDPALGSGAVLHDINSTCDQFLPRQLGGKQVAKVAANGGGGGGKLGGVANRILCN